MLEVMQVENLVGREIRNGAFTNGVAVANDGQDALARMEVALREMGIRMTGSENLEPWDERFADGAMPEDAALVEAFRWVQDNGGAEFGEFFCY